MRKRFEQEPEIDPLASMKLLLLKLDELEKTYKKAKRFPLDTTSRIKNLKIQASLAAAKLEHGTPLKTLHRNSDMDPQILWLRYSNLIKDIEF